MEAPNHSLAALGQRIRQKRLERGMTREQLAAQVGKAKGTVDKWEIGWSHPNRDNLASLAQALGVTEAFLRDGIAPHAEETARSEPITAAGSLQSYVDSLRGKIFDN